MRTRLSAAGLVILASCAMSAATVQMKDTGDVLVNPGMGLVHYHYSNRLWAYGMYAKPGEVDPLPGTSVVYFRVLWNDVEPSEGEYCWDIFDSVAQNWIRAGKKIAFRIICCNQTENAVPDWVRAAGAKGIWFKYLDEKADPRWEPVYDDPVFLDKYSNFLKAFAARYDGDPSVAFVDIGSFGLYGEGHTYTTSKLSRAETERLAVIHMDLHRKLLPRTLLVISDDFAGSDCKDPDHSILKHARKLGIAYRDDSLLCSPVGWKHDHWGRLFAPTLPVVLETGHYTLCAARGNWRKDRILESVVKHQASYFTFHGFPEDFRESHAAEIEAVNRRIGYRLLPAKVTFPDNAKIGAPVEIAAEWINEGVAPCLPGGFVSWSLCDARGNVCWSFTDEAFDVRSLAPTLEDGQHPVRRVSRGRFGHTASIPPWNDAVLKDLRARGRVVETSFDMLAPGDYTLCVSVGTRQGTPTIALPLAGGCNRRYPIGRLSVVKAAGGSSSDSAYVPEPQPVKSAVEITALYYPGTEHAPEWDMVEQTCPERKPLLGWYDEGNPEVVDWQIKWAVEHGITSFCVDWYWNKGHRRLEHWVKAFYKARYRSYLKWFMMYANHNEPGSHSTEDQIALTRYWLDNYFKTPEYYRIEDKPVVCIWDANKLDADFLAEAAAKGERLAPGEGLKRAFAITEKMVRDAGLPGIYWLDMWRTFSFNRQYAEMRREQGYRAATHYGVEGRSYKVAPEAMKPGEGPNRFSYDVVQAAVPKLWQELCTQNLLPYWLMIPTGWDDTPRSFGKGYSITERTVGKFAAVCRQAREFCDSNGVRHAMIMPINEWQEGSYVEPNEEYGFGMYDAIRDAFCEKPTAGWPANVTPRDVGLGPYDYPPMTRSSKPRWEFASGTTEGWYRQPYGGGEVENHDGCLTFVVTRLNNYNIRQRMVPFAASGHGRFRVRMRIEPNATSGLDGVAHPAMRLKWGTAAEPIIGKGITVDPKRCVATCPVKADGEWHEYDMPLAGRGDWTGMVDELWFEAVNVMHARVAIDWMRFE